MNGPAVQAHPFCWKAAAFAGANVPLLGVKDAGPRAPRLRRVIDAESALEACVAARQCLAPEVTLQPGVVTDAASITFLRVAENGSALMEVARPGGLSRRIQPPEKLIGLAAADLLFRNARQHHLVRGFVSAVRVRRIYVNKAIARAGVIPAEVDERRAAEATREFPIAPGPGRAMVAGPGELRIGRVPRPEIEHAVHHQCAARFRAGFAFAFLFQRTGADVDAREVGG